MRSWRLAASPENFATMFSTRLREVGGDADDLDAAGLDLLDVEQLVDEAAQLQGVALDRLQRPALAGVQARRAQQRVERREDQRQRRAQVVRDVGVEVPLRLLERAHLFQRRRELLVDLADLGRAVLDLALDLGLGFGQLARSAPRGSARCPPAPPWSRSGSRPARSATSRSSLVAAKCPRGRASTGRKRAISASAWWPRERTRAAAPAGDAPSGSAQARGQRPPQLLPARDRSGRRRRPSCRQTG